MTMLLGTLSGIGVFLVGLVARVGLLVAVVAALLAPVALAMGVARLYRVVRPRVKGLRRTGHVLYKPGARYSAGHTWVEREGARLRVGLDGVAQQILPWALGVRLPRPGDELAEGEVAVVIACGGMEARIAAPVSGRVVAVNAEVERDPSLVKDDGYGRGWLFAMEPLDTRWSTLPAGDLAERWMAQESERLDRFLEDRFGVGARAALAGPAPAQYAYSDWRDLTHTFLHA